MKVTHTPESLKAFENEIVELFNAGKIRAPVHLESGSEEKLLKLFQKYVKEEDWVLCSWRSHLKCLLKGVPEEELKQAILAGKSIGLCFPKYKILSSAIVGGICPIAVGLAMAIKRKDLEGQVFCFVGDMTALTGIYHECWLYSYTNELPLHWVIENNGVSTNTPTREAWGGCSYEPACDHYYSYENSFPHQGTGVWVEF